MKPTIELIPPEEQISNILYRQKLRKWALQSKANRQYMLDKCRDDYFFFIKSFFVLYEPRSYISKKPKLPFIPWPNQVPVMSTILENLGQRDIGIEKARGEGCSWTVLSIFLHQWLFYELKSFLIVSRNEALADKSGDLNSLGGKIDWELEQLPQWMAGRPREDFTRNKTEHLWTRKDNGSSLMSLATTADLAAGMRCEAAFLDELGRWQRGMDEDALSACEPVTECRIFGSTYSGADGAFYRLMHEETAGTAFQKVVMGWTKNPTRNQGMFRIDRKEARLLHPDRDEAIHVDDGYTEQFFKEYFPVLQGRGFEVDDQKKLWSPWYVGRCLRPRMYPKKIAQEYDMNPAGASGSFFPRSLIDPLVAKARPPVEVGEVQIHPEKLKVTLFARLPTGRLRLWEPLTFNGKAPPRGRYVIGCDLATGHGGDHSSNSVLSVVNRDTGEKAAEYASPTTPPKEMAELAVALCRWFCDEAENPAYLIWESNGPGLGFRTAILDTDFRNFHWRTPWNSTRRKPTREAGWWSGKDAKRDLLFRYRTALEEGFFDNPSEFALRECSHYIHAPGDALEYMGGPTDREDPSNAKANHGDRVIADALANYAMEELGGGYAAEAAKQKSGRDPCLNPPRHTFAYRAKQRRDKDRARRKNWW